MRFVRKPWGWYFVLLNRKSFKVKLLKFKPGKSCSMQKHKDRSELWLFLKGEGEFGWDEKCFDHVFDVVKGDFVHIPELKYHQYTAKKKTLVLEIQYGLRCDEEDIERV